MNERVCAVVVTYNRKTLLRECLHSLITQTRPPDEILVVNNASTDGTREMLQNEFPLVKVIDLPSNMGGAGGFHEGMKWAYEEGYNWIWLMDDDGIPAADCLQRLLELGDNELSIRAPLVLRKDDSEKRLAFGLVYKGRRIEREKDALGAAVGFLLEGVSNPFNGVLVHRSVVKKTGLPQKEFFLWGDETEYMLRAKKFGVKIGTVVKALFFHPPNRMLPKSVKVLWVSFSVHHTEDHLRNFLILRNGAYIAARYYGLTRMLKHFIKYFLFYLQEYGLIAGLWSLRVAWMGLRGDFKMPEALNWRS
ncbi:hypothetical protein E308F_28120 [Moorella sp. E308F]|uniref:glycosyltransferase family 2 protein n=1 Tax=Moorella sp. E308F TaxID=2572682 RepID=UPI0010FFB57E|nr:glycosyltransferase family 2 protein [Moorella sp. E308F]GEA16566.1 hypothetical protein E308F_28120 [Moorella sp. E308F]